MDLHGHVLPEGALKIETIGSRLPVTALKPTATPVYQSGLGEDPRPEINGEVDTSSLRTPYDTASPAEYRGSRRLGGCSGTTNLQPTAGPLDVLAIEA